MNSLLCYDDLVYAWQRASSGKKKRREVQQWMEHFDTNMQHLYTDIVGGTYQIGRTRRYIVQDPVLREIVVIPFRDRIVQHLIAGYLTPLFEKQFIYDNYANRVGKGTLFGIKRIDHHIRSISENYSRETWILKCDIQSSILFYEHKQIACSIIIDSSSFCYTSGTIQTISAFFNPKIFISRLCYGLARLYNSPTKDAVTPKQKYVFM